MRLTVGHKWWRMWDKENLSLAHAEVIEKRRHLFPPLSWASIEIFLGRHVGRHLSLRVPYEAITRLP